MENTLYTSGGGLGGGFGGFCGAVLLFFLTPAEHLCLPDAQDVLDGVVATRIAAHAADLARGFDRDIDSSFSAAREDLDWKKMFGLCIDPAKAKEYRAKRLPSEDTKTCSMCGKLCALEIVKKYLKEK